MNRDFKGVWIPKDIWLNEELTLVEKVILIEIDSLDNEDHCTASNEYLANFCQCSERKVSEAISKLVELGYIEVISFNGRYRVLHSLLCRLAESAMQGSKICESPSQNLLSINIDNKKDINIENYNNTGHSTLESEYESHCYSNDRKNVRPTRIKSTGKSLYQKCDDLIITFTHNLKLQTKIQEFLKLRLEMKDKPLYQGTWKGLLDKLSELSEGDETRMIDIVNRSIEHGWASFYPPVSANKQTKGGKFSEYGEVVSKQRTEPRRTDQAF